MGHSTNTGFVHVSTATDYLKAERERRGTLRLGMRPATIEDAAISAAVDTWRDEESERFENERVGATSLRPSLTLDQAELAVDNHALPDQWQVGDEQTVVVPIVDDGDVTVAKAHLTVALSPEDSAQLLGYLAVGARGLGQASSLAHEIALRKLGPGVMSASVVKSPKHRPPVAKATDGAATLLYYLVADGTKLSLPADAAASQSNARQAALSYAKAHANVQRVEVRARMVRPETAALVVVERPGPSSSSFTLAVEVATVKPGAAIIGYFVGFDSHH